MLQHIKVKTEKIYHAIEPKVKAERIIACILVLTPFILWLADDGRTLRDSISNYVYMCHSYPIWHYAFAILFFLGSAIITAFVSNDKKEWTRYVLAIAVVLPVVLALDFIGLFSLFWGEAISLFFIATHYLLESK